MSAGHVSRMRDIVGAVGPAWVRDTGLAQSFSVRDILGVLRRRIWTLIITFLLLTTAGTIITFSLTPQYEASSSVVFEQQQTRALDVEAFVSGLPPGSETIQTQVAIILSRDLAADVVRELRLYELPEFNPALREPDFMARLIGGIKKIVRTALEPITGPPEVQVVAPEERYARERVQVVSNLLQKLKVEPRPGTYVLDIMGRSESPELAARIVNAVTEFYLINQFEAKYEATRRASTWLTQRLAELREELEKAEAAVEAYRSRAGLLQGEGDSTLAQQQIGDVNQNLVNARARTAELVARLHRARELLQSPSGASSSAEALGSPIVRTLVTDLAGVQRRIAELSTRVGDNYPELVSARAEAADLEAAIAKEIAKVVESLENEVQIARAQEAAFEGSLNEMETRVADLNSRSAELRILQREADTARLMYDTFLSRVKETQGQEQLQENDARIVSPADVPLRPSFPNKPIFIALSAVIALFVGLIVVGLEEQFDRGIRSMEEVYRYLDMPCLGLVPAISRFKLGGRTPEAYVLSRPQSAYAEAVRGLRASIHLSEQGKKPRVIIVTSARPNEGKTSIAMSMARLNAMAGRSTLLIDFDLRKPEVGQRLSTKRHPGIIDYLTDDLPLQEVIQKDDASGLDFIVAGRRSRPTEVSLTSKVEQLIAEVDKIYDLVVLDAPPILALADTRLVARLAHKTIFVLRWGSTPKDVVRVALQQLADAGADVAGVAISMVDVNRNAKYGFGDSGTFSGAFKRYYNG